MATATDNLKVMTTEELMALQLWIRLAIAEVGPMADERGELIRQREAVSTEIYWRGR